MKNNFKIITPAYRKPLCLSNVSNANWRSVKVQGKSILGQARRKVKLS